MLRKELIMAMIAALDNASAHHTDVSKLISAIRGLAKEFDKFDPDVAHDLRDLATCFDTLVLDAYRRLVELIIGPGWPLTGYSFCPCDDVIQAMAAVCPRQIRPSVRRMLADLLEDYTHIEGRLPGR